MSFSTQIEGLPCPFYVCYQAAIPLSEYLQKWGWPDGKPIYRGYVFLTLDDLMALIQRREEAPKRPRRTSAEAPREEPPQAGDKPPCIVEVEENIKRGEEVGHFERFLLATWYFKRYGDNAVQILMDIFRHAPDFDPKKTEYQLRHISGQAGGRKKYSVPSCSTVIANGACPVGGACGVKSPAVYGIKRKGLGKLVIKTGGDVR